MMRQKDKSVVILRETVFSCGLMYMKNVTVTVIAFKHCLYLTKLMFVLLKPRANCDDSLFP